MAKFLIASGSILLTLTIIAAPFIVGYSVNRSRRLATTEFITLHQSQRTLLLTDTGEIDMPEIGEKLDPEAYFWDDPLFSYVLPAHLDQRLPIADEVFESLAAKKTLTGIGVDIDASWQDWGLDVDFAIAQIFEQELVAI